MKPDSCNGKPNSKKINRDSCWCAGFLILSDLPFEVDFDTKVDIPITRPSATHATEPTSFPRELDWCQYRVVSIDGNV